MHCHARALNVACGDTIGNCKLMQNALKKSLEFSELII